MYVVKCDSPACENAAEIEDIEIPDGWLMLSEHVPSTPGEEAGEVELGVFCSRACVAFYAGMEAAE